MLVFDAITNILVNLLPYLGVVRPLICLQLRFVTGCVLVIIKKINFFSAIHSSYRILKKKVAGNRRLEDVEGCIWT